MNDWKICVENKGSLKRSENDLNENKAKLKYIKENACG